MSEVIQKNTAAAVQRCEGEAKNTIASFDRQMKNITLPLMHPALEEESSTTLKIQLGQLKEGLAEIATLCEEVLSQTRVRSLDYFRFAVTPLASFT